MTLYFGTKNLGKENSQKTVIKKSIEGVKLEMGNNWTPELQRQFGDEFSTFCDFDLLQGAIACTMQDNPCLYESCYYDISDELAAVPSGHMTCEEWEYYLSKKYQKVNSKKCRI